MNYTFAAARLTAGTFFNSLIKKGRGIGPMKPWQPFRRSSEKGANSNSKLILGEISQIHAQKYFYHIQSASDFIGSAFFI